MNGVIPYGTGEGRVIVYETSANDGAVTFGVLLPQESAAEHERNRRALAVAKEFVLAMGGDPSWVTLNGCSFCHIARLEDHPSELWHLPAFRAWILPKSGCPKPPRPSP